MIPSSIFQLEDKVVLLEAELSNVINRHRDDKENLLRVQNIEDQSAMIEMDKLSRMMELKSREILKVSKDLISLNHKLLKCSPEANWIFYLILFNIV